MCRGRQFVRASEVATSAACRRQKLAENPEWHAKAEANRQELMARVLATDKPPAQVRPSTRLVHQPTRRLALIVSPCASCRCGIKD